MPLKIPAIPTEWEREEYRNTLLKALNEDLQQVEDGLTEFAKERERLGAYGADAGAIMDLAARQVQIIQLLRRAIGVLQK